MRRVSMVAMILGGAFLVAFLPGMVRRERGPAAPAPAPVAVTAPATAAAGGDLKAMLELGRKARLEPVAPAAERRRARLAAIEHGPADARTGALRMLALEDRPAADEIARRSLGDHVLFAEAARLLLVRPDGAPRSADLARVRGALRTGEHDEASRASVAALVLELLAARQSPEAPRFAALLQGDPSPRVRAVGERLAGGLKLARAPATPR